MQAGGVVVVVAVAVVVVGVGFVGLPVVDVVGAGELIDVVVGVAGFPLVRGVVGEVEIGDPSGVVVDPAVVGKDGESFPLAGSGSSALEAPMMLLSSSHLSLSSNSSCVYPILLGDHRRTRP